VPPWRIIFSETATAPSWRERALERTLEPARTRSVERLERFLDATRALANETGSAAFTVAQVATAAGLSLKSFYRCFASKDDLLVALLEEDSRLGATILAGAIDANDKPAARVHAYVTSVFELLTIDRALGYAGVLVREHRRLSEQRPDELARALAPMIDVLAIELERAAAAGVIVSSDPRRDAQTVFTLVLEGIYDVALGRAEPLEEATYLWGFCQRALGLAPVHRQETSP